MLYGLFNENIFFNVNKFDLIKVIALSALTIYYVTNSGFQFYNYYILEHNNIDEDDKIKEEVLYKDKYKVELKDFIETNNEEEKTEEEQKEFYKSLKYKVIDDELPNGLVKMFYNHDEETFNYYSNNKNIKYEELEALTRLYVIENKCVDLYINREEEYEKSKLKIEKKIELKKQNDEAKEENNKKRKSVFAQFKEYNVRPGGAKNMEENIIICEKSLRFSYKGNLKDFNLYYDEIANKKFNKIIKKKDVKENENENKEFSFKDFKRMIESVKTIMMVVYIIL